MAAIKSLSETNFVAPYKFIGATALSVESAIVFFILLLRTALIIFLAPLILVSIHSVGLYSAAGTCFRAAA